MFAALDVMGVCEERCLNKGSLEIDEEDGIVIEALQIWLKSATFSRE